jgi:hypothetical protein
MKYVFKLIIDVQGPNSDDNWTTNHELVIKGASSEEAHTLLSKVVKLINQENMIATAIHRHGKETPKTLDKVKSKKI